MNLLRQCVDALFQTVDLPPVFESRPKDALECGGLTPPLQRKQIAIKELKRQRPPPHSKGFRLRFATPDKSPPQ